MSPARLVFPKDIQAFVSQAVFRPVNRMRRSFSSYLTVAVVLATTVTLTSCRRRSSSAETIRKMQASACAGDAAGFFARVDRYALVHFAFDTLRSQRPQPPFQPSVNLANSKTAGSSATVEAEAQERVERLLAEWRNDIARGKEGELCRMHVVEPSNPDTGLIDVSMPTGKRTWLLSLMKDGPIVVGLADEPLHAP
jgi:hypothetical protein